MLGFADQMKFSLETFGAMRLISPGGGTLRIVDALLQELNEHAPKERVPLAKSIGCGTSGPLR
ncbi:MULTISPECIES: hypothetical protein [Rhizobium]|uniref:Uncharacterized protein n=1 Tax=Rhizobium favelukesii TaxID=348824 RepID=W6RRE4_9HYPH|nr:MULTISPECIES: hypothetical protein [Rhizobium]MCS0459080.1 hypothetical protein [Rhizobium favelukesii]UFS79653.1 hypothetical protein LPB79_08910 [Rhizobium sp. T136]CDM63279.1 hypothetical protein LPU83_pLPU83d_1909 [Rhizobium favelukesii]